MNSILMTLALLIAPFAHASEGWKKCSVPEGSCSISFPIEPQHVHEKMFLPKESVWINYDVYLSPLRREAIFVMMIAEYPKPIEKEKEVYCLQAFLKGMVGPAGQSRIIFADLIEVQGEKALEFFLQSPRSFFRGKLFLAGSKLFLIAVEALEEKNIQELFHSFAESYHKDDKISALVLK